MSQFSVEGAEFTAKDDCGYHREIASMMHGFGDNPTPSSASVALVESIVLQQLRAMVQEALNVSERRRAKSLLRQEILEPMTQVAQHDKEYDTDGKIIVDSGPGTDSLVEKNTCGRPVVASVVASEVSIANTDVVYLLRNNKMKLKRFYDYLSTADMVKNKVKIINGNEEPLVDIEDDNSQSSATSCGKSRKTVDVINRLDITGEVQAIDFDEAKYRRNARAAKLTESMSIAKYEAYFQARLVSFGRPGFIKSQQKFRAWLNPNNELNISQSGYDVLVYLAFETVAEIVDMVFLIRQDAKRRGDDPFSKYSAGNLCNPVSLSNAVYMKSGQEGVPAITVSEIREVLRRVFTPRTGVAGLFYRNMRSELPPKFIAI